MPAPLPPQKQLPAIHAYFAGKKKAPLQELKKGTHHPGHTEAAQRAALALILPPDADIFMAF